MSDLKKIEERYIDTEQSVTLIRQDHHAPRPASEAELDVRKLARALDRTPEIAGGMTGPGNTVEQCRGYSDACRDIKRALKKWAERTLEEVAGE